MSNGYKTLSVQFKPNKHELNLLKFLTKESKDVYNKTIFIFSFLQMFNDRVYSDLYKFITIFVKDNKDNKDNMTNCIDKITTKMYEIIESYYKFYISIKDQLKTNNMTIYNFVLKYINDNNIIVMNSNYISIYNHCNNALKDLLKVTQVTKYDLLDSILTRILKSFYTKNFYSVKNGLLNHTVLKITDKIFIEQVKNDSFLFKEEKVNWRKKIESDFSNFKKSIKKDNILLSCQNILSRIVLPKLNKKLPCDVKLNIITKAYDAISSFFALKQNGIKCNFPKYLPTDSFYNLYFYERSRKNIKIKNRVYTRLTVGEYISKNYRSIIKDSTLVYLNKNDSSYYKKYMPVNKFNNLVSNSKYNKKNNGYFIRNKYISKSNNDIINSYYFNIPFPNKLKNKSISFIEIAPNDNGAFFKINYVYKDPNKTLKTKKEKNIEDRLKISNEVNNKDATDDNIKNKKNTKVKDKISDIKNDEIVSFDLGAVNLVTIFDPNGSNYIIKGNYINNLNNHYHKLLDKIRSNNKDNFNVNTSNKYKQVLLDRSNKINYYLNLVVKKLEELYKNKKKIIIGYNKDWKNNVNLGRTNNRMFCSIPYKKFIDKMIEKFNFKEEIVVLREESYTSKCDALAFESICKHTTYSGERIKRGLFKSKNGKILNADLNGAINIMRKYCKDNNIVMNTTFKGNIFNPLRLKIVI